MADVVKQISVPEGVDALGVVLLNFAAAVKAGTPALTAAEAAVAPLIAAAGSISEVGADFTDPQIYVWGGLFAGELAQILAGKAPTPVAPV